MFPNISQDTEWYISTETHTFGKSSHVVTNCYEKDSVDENLKNERTMS